MSKIGLFDSGIGGLSVLKELIKVLPNEDYLFYEDSINNPYGNKSDVEILKIACKNVEYLLKNDCKIIVIACNTATTCCLLKLREIYKDVLFVGIVPAIKVAYDNHFKKTLILSTDYTMNSGRVLELITEYNRSDQEVINVSGENLAYLIDIGDDEGISNLLDRILSPYCGVVDSLVMGCTHYSLVKNQIQEVLPGVTLLDGCCGVANEVKHQLEIHNLLSNSLKGNVSIINNKDDSYVKRSFEILNL